MRAKSADEILIMIVKLFDDYYYTGRFENKIQLCCEIEELLAEERRWWDKYEQS